MGATHHDDHGHDDHGHDDHGHDDHAQHGPDPFIVLPSSEAVSRGESLGFGIAAFFGLLLLLAALVKVFA